MQGGDISNRLIFAVRDGRIGTVRELLASYSLSYSSAWSDGYVLLRHALEHKHTAVARLLLMYGPKVNSNTIITTTPLHFAVINGVTDIVQVLLDRAANINAIDWNHETPLHHAVENKRMEIIELLINRGAHINASNSSNLTPLHLAVRNHTTEIVDLLLKRCTDVHANGQYGTPLHMAAEWGDLQIVELLLKYGAHVNSMCSSKYWEGGTPLERAVRRGHKEVVKLLLESGANVDAQDKDGKTILYFAIENGCSVIIEDILKHCPDVNNKTNRSTLSAAVRRHGTQYNDIIKNLVQYGFTVNPEDANDYELLHAAVEKGYSTFVEQLLKYSTDVNILYNSTSGKCYMALHTAAKNKQEEIAELLISCGADVNARDATGNTPIFYATETTDLKKIKQLLTNKANIKDIPELLNTAVEKNYKEIVELFLQHGADVNASDNYGMKALHYTAFDKHEGISVRESIFDKDSDNAKGEIAELLLSRGADVNARVKNDRTTLHAAICKGYVKLVEALLEYNADVNSTCSNDRTPLSFAAHKGNEVITKMLLDKEANINAKDKAGRTALHIATAEHHKQVVEVLLKCGARVDSKTTKGKTPLHVAALCGDSDIVQVLATFGADIESKNEIGATALHLASIKGKTQIVTTLLDHGSDITVTIKDRYTALDLAEGGTRSSYSARCFYRSVFDDYDEYDYNIDHGISDHADIAEILKLHMVKLKTANLYAKNQHLLAIISDEKFSSFRNECEKEIISMKSEKVGNANISFYNILAKGISQLAIYAGNESVVQALRSNHYEIKFPIYASMINTHFRNGERRKELLEQERQHSPLQWLSSPRLPHRLRPGGPSSPSLWDGEGGRQCQFPIQAEILGIWTRVGARVATSPVFARKLRVLKEISGLRFYWKNLRVVKKMR